jgi:glucosamine--fructose-6-phosphate aminotransferase (isomerizing)
LPASTAIAPVSAGRSLFIVAISQSGETADTLAALRQAKSLGHLEDAGHLQCAGIQPSSANATCVLITRAGPEIGVASTKAFTTQLTALALLTLVMAKVKPTRLTPRIS